MGYGVVLDPGPGDANAPYQYLTTYVNSNGVSLSLKGAVTIWVRRLAAPSPSTGTFTDFSDPDDDTLVLTAEGIAPFSGATYGGPANATGHSYAQSRRAVEVLEVTLSRIVQPNCANNPGQIGMGQLGGNFNDCPPLNGTAQGIGNNGANVTKLW